MIESDYSCSSLSDAETTILKKKIEEEVIIDRAWLIMKKNGEYISPRVRCPFCLDLVYHPVECGNCGRIYCKDCYKQWKQNSQLKCLGGKDGHSFIYQETEQWIINYINSLKINCIYKNCEEIIQYTKFYQHALKCKHIKEGYKNLSRPEKDLFLYSEIPIFIKTFDDITYTFSVKPNFLVKELKKMLQEKIKIEFNEIVLNYGGKALKDSEPLETYNIQKNSTIFQHGRLKGGQ